MNRLIGPTGLQLLKERERERERKKERKRERERERGERERERERESKGCQKLMAITLMAINGH